MQMVFVGVIKLKSREAPDASVEGRAALARPAAGARGTEKVKKKRDKIHIWLLLKMSGLDQAPVPQTIHTSDPDPRSRPFQGS